MDLSPPYIIGGLTAILVMLILYTFLVPKGQAKSFSTPDDNILDDNVSDNKILKLASVIGSDFYASLPAGMVNEKKKITSNPRVESLLVRSGNPWNLKAEEFTTIQFVAGFFGFLISWLVWALVNTTMAVPYWVVVPLITFFAFMIPKLKYNEQAKKRDLEFKRQLPEALDLLIISLSGGRTFSQSMRDVLPNMQDGILKEEFRMIVQNIDTGKTLQESLNEFAKRTPNESITTFVRAVQSATEVNAPIIETLEARAEESRQEFFAMIHEKTAQLQSKIFMILTPTMMPAILVVAVAPAIFSMMKTLGS